MDDEEFYLILPSNSSMKYFPDNTTSCYTTHLSHEIRLYGNWCVGLTEIHIPCTFLHIQESEAKFIFSIGTLESEEKPAPLDVIDLESVTFYDYTIADGVYENITDLAHAINHASESNKHIVLGPSKKKKGFYTLRRVCECKEAHYIHFHEKIRRIFGFEKESYRRTDSIGINRLQASGVDGSGTRKAVTVVGDRPASLSRAIPDHLFIYTDICAPYTVGDTQAALLRLVTFDNTKYKLGPTMVKQFSPINYIPLLNNSFQNIIIDIRDQHGKRLPFEYGTLTVTLHFKRKH